MFKFQLFFKIICDTVADERSLNRFKTLQNFPVINEPETASNSFQLHNKQQNFFSKLDRNFAAMFHQCNC